MASLGEILKKQTADREASNLASQKAADLLKRKELEREEQSIRNWFEDVRVRVRFCAETNTPLKNIKIPDARYWDTSGYSNVFFLRNHKHEGVIKECLKWFEENDLKCSFIFNHDGIGISSWWELNIKPT